MVDWVKAINAIGPDNLRRLAGHKREMEMQRKAFKAFKEGKAKPKEKVTRERIEKAMQEAEIKGVSVKQMVLFAVQMGYISFEDDGALELIEEG